MMNKRSSRTRLVLASASNYRAQALRQLNLEFEIASPDADETPFAAEPPAALVQRLAIAKTNLVAARYSDAVIIGSDQVGFSSGSILGKPGNFTSAVDQLYGMRGQSACFYTAVAVHDTRTSETYSQVVTTELEYRTFSLAEVERYVALDEPFDCAGSFKAEALGIALFRAIKSDDPSALIGLPLIALTTLLQRCGINPLQQA
jgi:septum formation protein